MHIVGDVLDHVYRLARLVSALDEIDFHESAMPRVAGHIAEVLPEVVVAGGTTALDDGLWKREIRLN